MNGTIIIALLAVFISPAGAYFVARYTAKQHAPVDTSTVKKNEADTLNAQLNTILRMNEFAQQQNTELLVKNDGLTAKVNELHAEIAELNNKMSEQAAANNRQVETLQATLNSQSTEIGRLQGHSTSLESVVTKLTQDNAVLQGKIDSLQATVDALTKKNEEQNQQLTALLVKMAGPADAAQPTVESATEATKGNPGNIGSAVDAAKAKGDAGPAAPGSTT